MRILSHLCFRLMIAAFFIVAHFPDANAQNCDFAFSLTGADEFSVHATALTGGGNLLVAGAFKGSNVDFDPGINLELRNSPEVTNAFIASYTVEGVLNWVQTMGGESNLVFTDIAVDASGKIYACGWCRGTDVDLDPGEVSSNHRIEANTTGMVVAYYSANGTYRWGFIVPAELNAAFQSTVIANKIEIDASNNIFICGAFQTSRVDFDPGLGMSTYSSANTGTLNNYDAFIAKYDRNGVYNWSAAIQSNDFDLASSLAVDKDGNAYLCGAFSGINTKISSGTSQLTLNSAGATDIFISKFDADGTVIWAKNMGGPDNDQAKDIKLDGEGNVTVNGTYRGTADMGNHLNPALLSSKGDADCFFTRHNSIGELLFAKSVGSEKLDLPGQLAINAQNEILITGSYHAGADNDFDPGEGTQRLAFDELNSNNYLFVTNFTDEGSLNWATSGIAFSGMSGVSVLPLSENTVVVAGDFNTSTDNQIVLGENRLPLTTGGKAGIFVATFASLTPAPIQLVSDQKIEIYPNPVSTRINFRVKPDEYRDVVFQAQLYSSSGNLILTHGGNLAQIESKMNQVIQNLSPDYYFLQLTGEKNETIINFVKL